MTRIGSGFWPCWGRFASRWAGKTAVDLPQKSAARPARNQKIHNETTKTGLFSENSWLPGFLIINPPMRVGQFARKTKFPQTEMQKAQKH